MLPKIVLVGEIQRQTVGPRTDDTILFVSVGPILVVQYIGRAAIPIIINYPQIKVSPVESASVRCLYHCRVKLLIIV